MGTLKPTPIFHLPSNHPNPSLPGQPLHRVARRDVVGRRGELCQRPVDRGGIGLRKGAAGAAGVQQLAPQQPAAAIEGDGADAVPTLERLAERYVLKARGKKDWLFDVICMSYFKSVNI